MSRKVDTETLAILSRVTVDGNIIFLTCGQLDRKQYVAVNSVLAAIGGVWNRKAKGHIFAEAPDTALEALLLTGEYDKPADYGYFPTPAFLVYEMVASARLDSNMLVLEPSAGQGAIAEVVASTVGYDNLHCFELLQDNCDVLRRRGFISTYCLDFLSVKPELLYDRVIMNPPFAKQQDIDHVSHALKFVKPGGRLVSIMSSGVSFRQNRKTVDFLASIEGRYEMAHNPGESFKLSGTMVNTVTIIVDVA